jgi:hypothetical protein
MNTYWPVRPRSSSMSAWTCSGVNAIQFTTASKVSPSSIARTLAGSWASPCSTVTPAGSGRYRVCPRFSTDSSMPAATAARAHAELITPVPPRKRTRIPVTAPTLASWPLGR